MKKTTKIVLAIDILVSILAFFLIIYGTQKYGPGVSADTVAYLNAADSLANGEGLRYFAYTSPFIQWPPLYPAILAIPSLIGISLLSFSKYLNAIFLGLTIFVSVRMLRKIIKNKIVPYIFLGMCLIAFPLIKMSLYAWSEPMYLFFCAVVFYILFTTELNDGWLRPVIAMAIVSALACLTRYVGVTLVAAVCLYLLFSIKGWGNKFKSVFIYGSISVIPTLIFILRNYIQSQTLVGMRPPAEATLWTNIVRTGKTVLNWFFPRVESVFSSRLLLLLFLIIFAVAFLCLFIKAIKLEPSRKYLLTFMTAYAAIYLIYMIISATNVAFDPLGDRYLIPALIPLMMVFAVLLETIVVMPKSNTFDKAIAVTCIVLSVFVIFFYATSGIRQTFAGLKDAAAHGLSGYNSDTWLKEGVIFDRDLIEDADMIYSNNPNAINFIWDMKSHYTPKQDGIQLYSYENFLSESKDYDKQYLIWFGNEQSNSIYTKQMLVNAFDFTEIKRTAQYVIYQMNQK